MNNGAHPSSSCSPKSLRERLLQTTLKNPIFLTLLMWIVRRHLNNQAGKPILSLMRCIVLREIEEERHDEKTYRGIRILLNLFPEENRDREWHEASILLDGHFRRNAERTHVHLGKMRDTLKEHPEEFQSFWRYFMDVIHPYSLTAHGYITPLSYWNQSELWKEIHAVMNILQELGYASFLNSGTLLGMIREGDFLPHDDDVDLAVILNATSERRAAMEWLELKELLRHQVRAPHRFDPLELTHYKITRGNGLEIDLFPCWISAEKVSVWPYSHERIHASSLLPLSTWSAAGMEFPIPNIPRHFLELNYGASWSTSDPSFRFDWNRATEEFDQFIALVQKPMEAG